MLLLLWLIPLLLLGYTFKPFYQFNHVPAVIEPVFDMPFDLPVLSIETVLDDLPALTPSRTGVFAPSPLPGPEVSSNYLIHDHYVTPTFPLAAAADRHIIRGPTFILAPSQESVSNETTRFTRSELTEFTSMPEPAVFDGGDISTRTTFKTVMSKVCNGLRDFFIDIGNKYMGQPPFPSSQTLDIVLGWAVVLLVTIWLLGKLLHIASDALITKLRSAEEYNELLKDASRYCSDLQDTDQQLKLCMNQVLELETLITWYRTEEEAKERDLAELTSLRKQLDDLKKDHEKAIQKAEGKANDLSQELSNCKEQQTILEADQKAKSKLIREHNQTLQKKETELSKYKAQSNKADKLNGDLQLLKSDQKFRDADMATLKTEKEASKKSEASLQAQVAKLTTEKVEAILKADRLTESHKKVQATSSSENASLKKELAACKKTLEKTKVDAKEQRNSDTHALSMAKSERDSLLSKQAETDRVCSSLRQEVSAIQNRERDAIRERDRAIHENQKLSDELHAAHHDKVCFSSRNVDLEGLNKQLKDDLTNALRISDDFVKENAHLEPAAEAFLPIVPDQGSPILGDEHSSAVSVQFSCPAALSKDIARSVEAESWTSQTPLSIDTTTIPGVFPNDDILHSEDEPRIKFPSLDQNISTGRNTQQPGLVDRSIRSQRKLAPKTILPDGVSVLQLPGTVVVGQDRCTVVITADPRRGEPFFSTNPKAYSRGSLRARRQYHKDGVAASMTALGLKYSPNYTNLSPGEPAFIQLKDFKGIRRRHSVCYGEKDSDILSKVKDPEVPRGGIHDVPFEGPWVSSNLLEEISVQAARHPDVPADASQHLQPVIPKDELKTVPAHALCQLTDSFFTVTSRDSEQLSTVPRGDASYDDFKSARITDIIDADNTRLMAQKVAYAEHFSSFSGSTPFDKYRSTWSQNKEVRIEQHNRMCLARNAKHLEKESFDYSTESVQGLLAATSLVTDNDVVGNAQANDRPKPLAIDMTELRRGVSSGHDRYEARKRAQEAEDLDDVPEAATQSEPSSGKPSRASQRAPAAAVAPQAQLPPSAPVRSLKNSRWATDTPRTTPSKSTAAAPSRPTAPSSSSRPPPSGPSGSHNAPRRHGMRTNNTNNHTNNIQSPSPSRRNNNYYKNYSSSTQENPPHATSHGRHPPTVPSGGFTYNAAAAAAYQPNPHRSFFPRQGGSGSGGGFSRGQGYQGRSYHGGGFY